MPLKNDLSCDKIDDVSIVISHLFIFQGYTNVDNPFGDEHLLDTFVWTKKLEKEGVKDISKDEMLKLQKKKMAESRVSISKTVSRFSILCNFRLCLVLASNSKH